MNNYYQALGLAPNASPRKIREQYRKLAKVYHPDKLANPADKDRFEAKFKQINEAYSALSEVVQRANLAPKQRKLEFLYEQGNLFFEQKEWSKAMIAFNEILTIDSAYRDALTCVQEARRKHKYLAAQYAEADALFRQQKWTESMKCFEVVLSEAPNYRDASKKYKRARREQLMTEFMSQY